MDKKKQDIEQNLADKLFYRKKNYFEEADDKEIEKCYAFAEDYKKFIDISKTERETCQNAVEIAVKAGFKEFKFGDKLKVGDKRYYVNRNKSVAIFKIGKNNLEEHGIKILGAHIDSPRIDLKQNPMYEDSGFCFFKTHYYGGIKKYQWTTIPLALHGTIIKKDGSSVNVSIGEDENDPIFYINDLLPHLGQEQMMNNGYKIITGEQLNLVIGGKAYNDKKVKDKIKLNILAILNEKYGVLEEDFLSSELCAVPAFKSRDIGFDRAFIGAYGHDDKSCAYPALRAIIDAKTNDTVLTLLVDKEEIGSEGNTGMKSRIYEDLMEAVTQFFDDKKKHFWLLFNFGIGLFVAIILFSKLILFLLENYYDVTIYLFLGLITGTIFKFRKNISFTKKNTILFVFAFLCMFVLPFLRSGELYVFDHHFFHYLYVMLLGGIDAITSIVPGVSGTAIFMMLGSYEFVLTILGNPF